MNKLSAICCIVALAAGFAFADIYRNADYEPLVRDELKLRIEKLGGNDYLIAEDAELFQAKFATVHFPEYHLSYAQQKELAKEVALTIVRFHHTTNAVVRFGHYEYPEAKGTNITDKLIQWIGGRFVTDELVPLSK